MISYDKTIESPTSKFLYLMGRVLSDELYFTQTDHIFDSLLSELSLRGKTILFQEQRKFSPLKSRLLLRRVPSARVTKRKSNKLFLFAIVRYAIVILNQNFLSLF